MPERRTIRLMIERGDDVRFQCQFSVYFSTERILAAGAAVAACRRRWLRMHLNFTVCKHSSTTQFMSTLTTLRVYINYFVFFSSLLILTFFFRFCYGFEWKIFARFGRLSLANWLLLSLCLNCSALRLIQKKDEQKFVVSHSLVLSCYNRPPLPVTLSLS